MARQNLSTNPALGANATDWSGGTRVAVTGFQRPNGYQSSGVNFFHDILSGIVAGSSLLISFDHKLGSTASPRLTIVWSDAGGGFLSAPTVEVGNSMPSGVVTRYEVLVTPPANAAQAEFQFKSFPSGSQVTAVLVEHRADIQPYFDGESEGAVWDGVRYNSTSTIPDVPPYEGPTKWVTEGFEDTNYEFTLTGDWTRVTDSTFAGTYAMKSSKAGVSNSVSELNVTPPTDAQRIRFARRVSSEADWDWFRVFVDGAQILELSGEVAWATSIEYSVVGAATVTFQYSKDGNTNGGSDAAWIDQLEFEVPDLGAEPGRFLIAYF